MTIDPFDDLERQLRERVRVARSAVPGADRPRRRLLRRTPLIAIAAVGLTLSGGALAATSLTRPGDDERGRRIASRAQQETRTEAACTMTTPPSGAKLAYVDAPVLPAIKEALPWITTPPTPREERMARQLVGTVQTSSPLIRNTLHALDMGAGRWVFVSVQQGRGWFNSVSDPEACAALREARVRALSRDRPGVLRAAMRRLAAAVDVAPGVQVLSVMTTYGRCRPGSGRCGGGGGSLSLWPNAPRPWNRKVPLGLMGSMGKRYTGLASPQADHLTVRGKYPERLAGVPRRIAPNRGFWVLDLPKGSGPVRVTERATDGTVLRVVPIRGHYRP